MKKIIAASSLALLLSVSTTATAMAATENNVFVTGISELTDIKLTDFSLKIKLDKTNVSKKTGDKFTVKAKTNFDGYIPTFYSTDSKVASVTKDGKVTCKNKGSVKIVAECNGVKSVCKLNVTKPKRVKKVKKVKKVKEEKSITDSQMSKIAQEVGWQTQHTYKNSEIMCSAYAYAYAYYQVTGKCRTAGSFWYGGCTWEGGTYHYCSSSSEMLNMIKSEIDNNKSCVGLLSIGNSATHYVTFYDYTGDGTNLSDYKILDPWNGSLETGSSYGFSSAGYDVVTVDSTDNKK